MIPAILRLGAAATLLCIASCGRTARPGPNHPPQEPGPRAEVESRTAHSPAEIVTTSAQQPTLAAPDPAAVRVEPVLDEASPRIPWPVVTEPTVQKGTYRVTIPYPDGSYATIGSGPTGDAYEFRPAGPSWEQSFRATGDAFVDPSQVVPARKTNLRRP